jgi:hypothetical protein
VKDAQQAAIFGGILAVISVLVGLISGVSFGSVLLRAFFFGVLGTGAFLGGIILLRSAIPELFSEETGDVEKQEIRPEGGVDIVIEEENPHDAVEMVEEVEEDSSDLQPVDLETVQEHASEMELPSEQEEEVTVAAKGGLDSIDGLPSLEGFEDNFSEVPAAGGASPGVSNAIVDIEGTQHDPSIVAKAVQTLLKKDQEG